MPPPPQQKQKQKHTKAPQVRAREVEMIRSQLDDLGLSRTDIAGVHDSLETFAADGTGVTRSWKVPAFGVTVTLLLSTQPHVVSYAKISKS